MKLIFILVIIKIIECIKVTDFCHQISNDNKLITCHGKYSFKCGHAICSVDIKACRSIIIFSTMTIAKEGLNQNKFKSFKNKIWNCTKQPKYKWSPNDVCLNSKNCMKSSFNKRLPLLKCKCIGKYSYNCNNGYCASNKKACKGLKRKPISKIMTCKK